MVFVPLPLFATFLLVIILARFVMTRDMSQRAHQLFAALVALYAAQSLILTLRWGYGWTDLAPLAGFVAPVLPVVAYLAFAALSAPLGGWRLWPLLAVALNWAVLLLTPQASDLLILVTYLGFGGMLIRHAAKGADHLPLSPLGSAREIAIAMGLTGAALVASGLTDIYVIVDFIRNEGQSVGLIVTFAQTTFVLVIGIAAAFGRASIDDPVEAEARPAEAPSDEDGEIVARLETLFEEDGLHRSEDLSLRRLARRLHLPDRRLSNAINRSRGMSVSQFVNEARIKEACKLLATTDSTILEVSLAAGFATKSNFNREFLRVVGMTPSRWREQNSDGARTNP